MNVALIIERIEPWRGGAETSTMQFVSHLARTGCRVSILTTSPAQSTPDYAVVPIRASRLLRSARTVMFARRSAAYVRSHPFDVVHCITPCPAADVYQPRGGTIPEMLERNAAIRTSPVKRGLKRLGQTANTKYFLLAGLERRLLTRRPAPWVIAISDYVARQLQGHYGFDPERIVRIFNGVDPDLTPAEERRDNRVKVRRQYGLDYDEYVALCIAHNFKLKGVHRIIEALARPAAVGVKLVVVGRDNPTPYAQLAQNLGVADRVIFAGPTQRIQAFLHAADVLVHPTYYDPCSRVVLEALASGLPAITTRQNGAAERIVDGQHGFVLDSPEDVAGLAERIGILADVQQRERLAARAAEAVRDISMKHHAEAVRALYDRVVAERGAGRRG